MKFKLQTGHVIKVDEADAYILRSKVWNGRVSDNGNLTVCCGDGALTKNQLSHYLAAEHGKEVVAFVNGDRSDFRRENLCAMTKKEWDRHHMEMMRLNRWETA